MAGPTDQEGRGGAALILLALPPAPRRVGRARPVRADPGHRRLGADALRIFAIFDCATVARLARAVIARLGYDLGRGSVVVEIVDHGIIILAARSEARRVGQECVSTCRSRWSRNHSKNTYTMSTVL